MKAQGCQRLIGKRSGRREHSRAVRSVPEYTSEQRDYGLRAILAHQCERIDDLSDWGFAIGAVVHAHGGLWAFVSFGDVGDVVCRGRLLPPLEERRIADRVDPLRRVLPVEGGEPLLGNAFVAVDDNLSLIRGEPLAGL